VSEASKDIGNSVYGLTWSQEGLVANYFSTNELAIIDPKTLEITARIPCSKGGHLAVAPQASLAVVIGYKHEFSLIDLKKRAVIAEEVKDRPPEISTYRNNAVKPAFTPDGKYLFVLGNHHFHRLRVDGKTITFDEARTVTEKLSHYFAVSADGKFVGCYYSYALPAKTKIKQIPNTEFFSTSDWKTPLWQPGEQHTVLAFDGKGRLYAQDLKNKLTLITNPMDDKRESADLAWPYQKLRAIVPSPDGNSFLGILTVEKSTAFRVIHAQIIGK